MSIRTRVDGEPVVGLVGEEVDDEMDAPPAVAQRGRDGEQHQREGDGVRPRAPVEEQGDGQAEAAEDRLLGPAEIEADELEEQKCRGAEDQKAEYASCKPVRRRQVGNSSTLYAKSSEACHQGRILLETSL